MGFFDILKKFSVAHDWLTGKIKAGAIDDLSMIEDGLFTANSTGRGKFASGFVNTSLLASEAVTNAKIKKAFGAENTHSIDAGANVTLAKGIYLVVLGANTVCEYTPDGGTTWRQMLAAGSGGVVISDGASVRLRNTGGASEDSYSLPLS